MIQYVILVTYIFWRPVNLTGGFLLQASEEALHALELLKHRAPAAGTGGANWNGFSMVGLILLMAEIQRSPVEVGSLSHYL